MRDINRKYRGKDKTTNVLSFAFEDSDFPSFDLNILGEIFVSIEKVKQDVKDGSRTILEEAVFVVTHGILHLLGYDHKNDKQEEEMVAKERYFMSFYEKFIDWHQPRKMLDLFYTQFIYRSVLIWVQKKRYFLETLTVQ